MKRDDEVKKLEGDIDRLQRALTNPNLVASRPGTDTNRKALDRMGRKQAQIERLKKRPNE